jgi:rRNA maturation endonuclease Nob1
MGSAAMGEKGDAMPEPSKTGSSEEDFRCPHCGDMYPTEGKDEGVCPVCGTRCTREKCTVMEASSVDF